MTLYLGIDPGRRTGAALIHETPAEISLVAHWDIPDAAEGFTSWWRSFLIPLPADRIIVEQFTLREGVHGVDLSARDVIGALSALNELNFPVEFRPAGGRLKQAPDRLLKALGLYLEGKANRNAREAVRHVIAHLKAEKHPIVMEAYRDSKTPE